MKKFLLFIFAFLFAGQAFGLTSCPAGTTRKWLLVHTGSTIDLTNDSGHVIGRHENTGYLTTTASDADNTCGYVQDGYGGWDTGTTNPDYATTVKFQYYMFIDGSNAKGVRIPSTVGIVGDLVNPGKKVTQLENVDSGSASDRTCTFMDQPYFRVAVCQD